MEREETNPRLESEKREQEQQIELHGNSHG